MSFLGDRFFSVLDTFIGNYITNMTNDVQCKLLIRQLKDELQEQFLSKYGNELYFNDLDRFMENNNTFANFMNSCFNIENNLSTHTNKLSDRFINDYPQHKRCASSVESCVSELSGIIFNTINKITTADQRVIISHIKKSLDENSNNISNSLSQVATNLESLSNKLSSNSVSRSSDCDFLFNLRIYYKSVINNFGNDEGKELKTSKTKISRIILPKIDVDNQIKDFLQALSDLYVKKEIINMQFIGDGGAGKTIGVIQFWKEIYANFDRIDDIMMSQMPFTIYIPLNNDIFNIDMEYPIKRYLSNACFTEAREWSDDQFWDKLFKYCIKNHTSETKLLIILDGFNEITRHRHFIYKELSFLHQYQEDGLVKIIITSRSELDKTANVVEKYKLYPLLSLSAEDITEYIKQSDAKIPDSKMISILNNPMMLTLYCETSEIKQKIEQQKIYGDFPNEIRSYGGLMRHWLEAQIVKTYLSNNNKKTLLNNRIYLQYVLSAVAYKMYINSEYSINDNSIKNCIKEYFRDHSAYLFDMLYNYGNRYDISINDTHIKKYLRYDETNSIKKNELINETIKEFIDITDKVFCVLSINKYESNGKTLTYTFKHENYRDFFAAMHVSNVFDELQYYLDNNESQKVIAREYHLCSEIIDSVLYSGLRKLVGQIMFEDLYIPYWDKQNGWVLPENKKRSSIRHVLDYFKLDKKNRVSNLSINLLINIIYTLSDCRGRDLSGEDLSQLDLRGISLNDINLSKTSLSVNSKVCANFDNSIINSQDFMPQGHCKRVMQAVYNRLQSKIATASLDKTVKEWDVMSSKCLKTYIGHTDCVNSVEYSKDSLMILTASKDKTIRIWSTDSTNCIELNCGLPANFATFNQDEKKVLVACDKGTIQEWDIVSRQCIMTIHVYDNEIQEKDKKKVSYVTYGNNDKTILSASYDGIIREWLINNKDDNETTFSLKQSLTPDINNVVVTKAKYNKKCTKILAAYESSEDNEEYNAVYEWSGIIGNRTKMLLFKTNGGALDASYDESETKVISGDKGRYAIIWDSNKKSTIAAVYQERPIYSAIFKNKDVVLLGTEYCVAREIDLITSEIIRDFEGHSDWNNDAKFSSDGKHAYVASRDNTIKAWDIFEGKVVQKFLGHFRTVSNIDINCNEGKMISCAYDEKVIEWDINSGQILNMLKVHENYINSVSYNKSCTRFITASKDMHVKEHEFINKNLVRTLDIHDIFDVSSTEKIYMDKIKINKAIYDPDKSKKILIASNDGMVYEYNLLNENDCKIFPHKEAILCICYNDDASSFFTGSDKGTLKKWSLDNEDSNGFKSSEKRNAHNGWINGLAIHPIRGTIFTVSSDKSIKEWDIHSLTQTDFFIKEAHNDIISSISISSDGRYLITTGWDKLTKVWDYEKKECLYKFYNYYGVFINACDFTCINERSLILPEDKEVMLSYGAIFSTT